VIDCGDTEACLRVRDHGFRIAVAGSTDITHELGEMVPLRPFCIPCGIADGEEEHQYHSPFRQYYVTRDNTSLSATSASGAVGRWP